MTSLFVIDLWCRYMVWLRKVASSRHFVAVGSVESLPRVSLWHSFFRVVVNRTYAFNIT